MNKVLIVIMFILLGTSLIVVSNMGKGVENSYVIEYQNNKNLALPDISGATEITDGLYRLIVESGVYVDYNVYNGIWTINGITTNNVWALDLVFQDNMVHNVSYQYVDGSMNGVMIVGFYDMHYSGIGEFVSSYENNYQQNKNAITNPTASRLLIILTGSTTFNNYQFKIQLEQGQTATSYVVPKLIPVYKDNLTQQEKNNIGLGAFGGITKIIKTISDIIKPVGDFINGLLSLF